MPGVIFSPGALALRLAEGLKLLGADVTLYSPGAVTTSVHNVTADLSCFEAELAVRGDTYSTLLKKHPFLFVTLARQVQAELVARAFADANRGDLDIVHIYTNEEELSLVFASLCHKPVVFTHHDPFNFLVRYKAIFPKYSHLNWLALSESQRAGMPPDTHWLATIYHGLPADELTPLAEPSGDYFAFCGRIIEPKGVHIAIAAVKEYNRTATRPLPLRIAGKHYADTKKDTYWQRHILPFIDGKEIIYDGFIAKTAEKRQFMGNAVALLMPSLFEEPFGLVTIEALACGTPVVGLRSGAIGEIIAHGDTGFVEDKAFTGQHTVDVLQTARRLAEALRTVAHIKRADCRAAFEARFTAERMCRDHLAAYRSLIK